MVQQKAIMAILPVRFYKNMVSLVANSVVLYFLFNNEPIKRLIGQIQFPSLLRKNKPSQDSPSVLAFGLSWAYNQFQQWGFVMKAIGT